MISRNCNSVTKLQSYLVLVEIILSANNICPAIGQARMPELG